MSTEHGQQLTAGPQGHIRASDPDRELAVDVIKAAFSEGRLSKEELSARVERAYSAHTHAELQELSADLPQGLPSFRDSTAARPAAGPPRTNPLAVASLVCALVPGIPQIAAIIMAIGAHRQIRRTGERGTMLATAGLALGVLGPLLTVLVLFVF